MADHCMNGCGNPAGVTFAGCCSEECLDQLMARTPPVPLTEDFVERLRASVEEVEVDLEAPLPRSLTIGIVTELTSVL